MLRSLLTGVSRKAARHTRSKPFRLGNPAPLVSFTFDDVPDSAYLNGAAVLEAEDCRGTFYIAAGIAGSEDEFWRLIRPEQISALCSRGHEIGCHTFSHIKVDTLDAAALDAECDRNAEALCRLYPGLELTSFCYPFGRLSLARKHQLQARFDTCRGIYEGINAGIADLALLRVIELYDRTLMPEKLERVLNETREKNGWLIFYAHDVAERPSWIGCSPDLMRRTLDAVRSSGFEVLTVRDALRQSGYSPGA
jgi:peptidoglycan/xylan/chitin deacetylase (PgdA/CDA1 family)